MNSLGIAHVMPQMASVGLEAIYLLVISGIL